MIQCGLGTRRDEWQRMKISSNRPSQIVICFTSDLTTAVHWGRDDAESIQYLYRKNNNLNPYLTPYMKISARQIVFAISLYLDPQTNCEDNMVIYALL